MQRTRYKPGPPRPPLGSCALRARNLEGPGGGGGTRGWSPNEDLNRRAGAAGLLGGRQRAWHALVCSGVHYRGRRLGDKGSGNYLPSNRYLLVQVPEVAWMLGKTSQARVDTSAEVHAPLTVGCTSREYFCFPQWRRHELGPPRNPWGGHHRPTCQTCLLKIFLSPLRRSTREAQGGYPSLIATMHGVHLLDACSKLPKAGIVLDWPRRVTGGGCPVTSLSPAWA